MRQAGVILILLCGFCLFALPALAQRCSTQYEVIVKLYKPRFGVPTVWDANYEEDGSMVQLMSSLPLEGGTMLSVGRTIDKESFKPKELLLVELNRRGRALMEKRFPAKEAETPTKIIKIGNGYLVSSNMTGGRKKEQRWVRLSWYKKDGSYRKDLILKDGTFDYEGFGLVPATEGNGFVVILHAINRSNPEDENGVLMRFTDNGSKLWRRAYRPGIPNQLSGLAAIDERSYMATGRIRMEDGRMAGWVMRLGYDGTVFWQRTFPRGGYSTLRDITVVPYRYTEEPGFILTGDAAPLDKGAMAAWVMALDPAGQQIWQRYFRRDDYKFSGEAVMGHKDGRISLALNAEALDETEEKSHVRFLTLSPRGVLIQDEAYISGIETKMQDFVEGWTGERIGTAIIVDDNKSHSIDEMIGGKIFGPDPVKQSDINELEEEPEPTVEGWVFIGTALDPYEDPCRD